jgi:TonB-dependent receptor
MEVRNRLEDQRFALFELSGQHRFPSATVDYSLARAQASEELPDRTYFLFSRPHPLQGLSSNELLALYLEQNFDDLSSFQLVRNRFDNKKFDERDHTAQLDGKFTFLWGQRQSSLKTGLKIWQKLKTAREQRWQYRPPIGTLETSENDYVFVDMHYDDERATERFPLANYSPVQQLLNYDADETIYAAYLMQTAQWTPHFSALYGVRYEEPRHTYKHRASFEKSDERYANFLPSLHRTYRLGERINLRLALTSGLSRPEYTRLLPITTPPDDGFILQGNPQLAPTQAQGIDLLFENFPGTLGLFSAGFFAKRITDPIVTYSEERGIFTLLRPINGDTDRIWGLEFAFTRHLKRFDRPLIRHTGLYANYTYSSAHMDYGTARSDDGPLPGNARHTGNMGLFYDETHTDFSARQSLTEHLALFAKINNLTSENERELFGNSYKKSPPASAK